MQTTLIPAGGTTIAEFSIQVSGKYTFVDHSIFRAEKGAKGILMVEGSENPEIYTDKIQKADYEKRNPDAGFTH